MRTPKRKSFPNTGISAYSSHYILLVVGLLFLSSLSSKLQARDIKPSKLDSIEQLETVTVYGNRQDRTLKMAAPTTRISRLEIERLGLPDLASVLRGFSGVTVRDYGGVGGLKTVSVRGLDAGYTAVTVDGIPMGDIETGKIDIGQLSMHQLESVTLTSGSTSGLFLPARVQGSPGTLHLRSRKPACDSIQPISLWAKIRGGSFTTIEPAAGIAHRINSRMSQVFGMDAAFSKGNYPFEFSRLGYYQKSRRRNSEVKSGHATYDFFWDTAKDQRFHTKLYGLLSDRNLPGSVVMYNDHNGESLYDARVSLQTSYIIEPHDRPISIDIHAKGDIKRTIYQDINNKYLDGIRIDRYTAKEYYGGSTVRYAPPTENWGVGAGLDYWYNHLETNLKTQLRPRRHSVQGFLATQYQWQGLKAEGRLVGFLSREKVERGLAAGNKEHLSPSANLSWNPSFAPQLSLRASWQDLYRMPTFNELYYESIGSFDLRPERGSMWNLGVTYGDWLSNWWPWFSIQVDAHHNSVRDKIVAVPTLFLWRMSNVELSVVTGVDAQTNSQWRLAKGYDLHLKANYSYQHATDITDRESPTYGQQLPYIPKHSGSASISLITPYVTIGYIINISGVRYANALNNYSSYIPAYADQSVSLTYPLRIGKTYWELQAAARNLGGRNYELIQFYPMPGRSFDITIKLQY